MGIAPVSNPELIACDDARLEREGVITAEVMAVEADHGYSVESVCGVEPDVPTESDRVEALFFSPVSGLANCCWVDAECECE